MKAKTEKKQELDPTYEEKIKDIHENVKPNLFKPGESGNPNGRPKGTRNITTLFDEALRTLEEEKGLEDAEKEIIKTVLIKARNGDSKFAKLFLEYRYGKPTQTIDLQGELNIKSANINATVELFKTLVTEDPQEDTLEDQPESENQQAE